MMDHAIIYLHGFASSPASRKATFFKDRFAELGIPLIVPDMAQGDFEHLTISGQIALVDELAGEQPVSLIGSSLGGYVAALYAANYPGRVRRLILLAPAFHFVNRWPELIGGEAAAKWKESGKLAVYHYGDGRERQLGYQIVEDGTRHPAAPDFQQPALIFHGTQDDVVPARLSEEFAAAHPNASLRLLDSGHELTDVLEVIWPEAAEFLMGQNG